MALLSNSTESKLGRNDPCICGSGKKYKQCCLNKAQRPMVQLDIQSVARINTLLDNALAYHHQQQLAQAEMLYLQILSIDQNQPDALNLLGLIAHQTGKQEQAVKLISHAIAVSPNFAEAHVNIGLAKQEMGKIEEARSHYIKAMTIQPNMVMAINNYANILHLFDKDHLKSIECYQQALAIAPDFAMAAFNMGNAFKAIGKHELAKKNILKAYELSPNHPEIIYSLASLELEDALYDEAIKHYELAIEINPGFAMAHHGLAMAFQRIWQIEKSIEHYQKAAQLDPSKVSYSQDAFLIMQYSTKYTEQEIFRAYRHFSEQFEQPLKSYQYEHANTRCLARKLKIGYVSADFRFHAVANFMLPIMTHHDREHFEIFCYYNNEYKDQLTDQFMAMSDHWYFSSGVSDDDLAERIRQDGIDILVDLSGHTVGNRLLMFARKPSPIQISWMGYVGTTGLSAFDYRICDRFIEPALENGCMTYEKPWMMERLWYVYQPCIKSNQLLSDHAMEVRDTPSIKKGRITLGSLNTIAKINQNVIEIWASILNMMPDADLALVVQQSETTKENVVEVFKQYGIESNRIIFFEFEKNNHYLLYHEIDLMLDPFPYNGGTSTCDALWMGVPFVTLEGNTVRGRMGTTIAHNIGHSDWIAKSKQDYIDIVLRLTSDLDALNETRLNLRSLIKRSPLLDAKGFTLEYEHALRSMWESYCQQSVL